MPSIASKVTLLGSIIATGGIIFYVHKSQVDDRSRLHRGIELDLERQAGRRSANIKKLQDQQSLTKSYRKQLKEEDTKTSDS